MIPVVSLIRILVNRWDSGYKTSGMLFVGGFLVYKCDRFIAHFLKLCSKVV